MTCGYFDFQLPADAPQYLPAALAGAVIYGAQARTHSEALRSARPSGFWTHAETLTALTPHALSDPPPAVLDMQLMPALLHPARLKKMWPEWGLLCKSCGAGPLIKLHLPPGAAAVAGARLLAQRFPQTRFLADAFRHGPGPGWQAHVRLADCPNVWVTTLGLAPGPARAWTRAEDVAEAMYFSIGEVGAGKVLFASGLSEAASGASGPAAWLGAIATLNDAERELILEKNAREVLKGEG